MNPNIVSIKLERNDLTVIATHLNTLLQVIKQNRSINKIEISYLECTVQILITKHARLTAKKYTLRLLKYDALMLAKMLNKISPNNLYAKALFIGIIQTVDQQTV